MLVTTKEQLFFSSIFVNIISKCLASNYIRKFNHSKITTYTVFGFTTLFAYNIISTIYINVNIVILVCKIIDIIFNDNNINNNIVHDFYFYSC